MVEENLKMLIIERYGNINNFCKAANIPWSTLDTILKRGITHSSFANIIKISSTLGIDIKDVMSTSAFNALEKIKMLCQSSGISVTDLEKRLGFGNGSLAKSSDIRASRLSIVAKYFNVSIEYLLGLPEPPAVLSSDEYELIEKYRALNESGRNYILYTLNLASAYEQIKKGVNEHEIT